MGIYYLFKLVTSLNSCPLIKTQSMCCAEGLPSPDTMDETTSGFSSQWGEKPRLPALLWSGFAPLTSQSTVEPLTSVLRSLVMHRRERLTRGSICNRRRKCQSGKRSATLSPVVCGYISDLLLLTENDVLYDFHHLFFFFFLWHAAHLLLCWTLLGWKISENLNPLPPSNVQGSGSMCLILSHHRETTQDRQLITRYICMFWTVWKSPCVCDPSQLVKTHCLARPALEQNWKQELKRKKSAFRTFWKYQFWINLS